MSRHQRQAALSIHTPSYSDEQRQHQPSPSATYLQNSPTEIPAFGNSHSTLSDSAASTDPSPAAKSFSCSVCQKTFTRAFNVREHMQVHEPERVRSFLCELCSRCYFRSADLARHLKNRHAGAGMETRRRRGVEVVEAAVAAAGTGGLPAVSKARRAGSETSGQRASTAGLWRSSASDSATASSPVAWVASTVDSGIIHDVAQPLPAPYLQARPSWDQ
ncbi:hypothetical protein HKX48_005391 [Thoreauomyces humboldtii]|nr:hypothetical protein HKX48_005391 [Thoreauomyces humboldtii]